MKLTEEHIPARYTNPQAGPTRWRTVENAQVVEVHKAFHRGAVVDGFFEVDTARPGIKERRSGPTIEVICTWYGVRPKTKWMTLRLQGTWKLHESYSGEVIADINATPRPRGRNLVAISTS